MHWLRRLGRSLALVAQLLVVLVPLSEGHEERALSPHVEAPRTTPHNGHRPDTCPACTLASILGQVDEPPRLDEALVTPWLLPEVYDRMRAGRGELLTELRPAVPVFLRFDGIDFDDDPDAIEKLDGFVRRAQAIMAGYGGNVLQLTLGDKGAYLYGVFGSPVAHEDDAARAASAALELRDLERTTDARDIQIGVTLGRLRSGTYGHAMRRTFVCLGDAVNLAARLMSKAPAGAIYVEDAIRQGAGDAFIWEPLPPMSGKG
jgi:class 3 adenylate cyclase